MSKKRLVVVPLVLSSPGMKKWDGHTLGEAKNTQILDDLSSLIEG